MGLEDFERQLAAEQEAQPERKRSSSKERREDRHKSKHRHDHRSSKHNDHEHGKRRKRSRDGHERDHEEKYRKKRVKSESPSHLEDEDDGEDEWMEKEAMTAPPEDDILDQRDQDPPAKVARDSWMEAPSALNIDYVQRSRVKKSPPSQFVSAKVDHERKVHEHDVEHLLQDLEDDGDEDAESGQIKDEPAQHEVSYTFGDPGSQWRMAKLKNAYREAEETGKEVEEVALKQYGNLRDFDDAREEQRELDRRTRYGKDYVGLEKPSGELYQDRKMAAGIRRAHSEQASRDDTPPQGEEMQTLPNPVATVSLDSTALNKLKAKLMKAKLRNDPEAASLEAEYNAAVANSAGPSGAGVVVLSKVDNRLLAGGRGNEVKAVTTKRGVERGQVVENDEMSIEDMVRQERRTRGTGQGNEGLLLANRIAKDGKFTDDLEYMDDNASKLAKRDAKSDTALRSAAIGDYQRTQRVLDNCPLCHHEDRNEPPAAPIISLGTRTYLTLATEPELVRDGCVVVPVQHRANLLECDDDEWEELRNFMKSLTRLYAAGDRGVVFYENAADPARGRHAALVAVPLPWHKADTAPGFFKEAILASDEEWSQHRKIIDTAAGARDKYGRQAMRKMLVSKMPYFHVWFNLDGGLGHVVEDQRRWPKGDLFAREIIGGMMARDPATVKKQGRWIRQDHRIEGFRKKWDAFDWTKVLLDAQ